MVSMLIYEDVDTYNAIVLQRLHAKTDMLLLMIRDNYLEVRRKKSLSPEKKVFLTMMPILAPDVTLAMFPYLPCFPTCHVSLHACPPMSHPMSHSMSHSMSHN